MVGGNDYVIQCKGNSPKLLNAIKSVHEEQRCKDQCTTNEKQSGRSENREVFVYKATGNTLFEQWSGLQEIVVSRNWGTRKGNPYDETHYYISSLTMNAQEYCQGIRKHWGIENKLHWTKDTQMNEDRGRIKDKNHAATHSMIRNYVINIYKQYGYRSIMKAIERHANRLEECLNILRYLKYNKIRSE